MSSKDYLTHIKSKNGWFDIDFKELVRYKDLILLFSKRNYTTRYKQTVLGPLWLFINPLITVMLYAFVFGNIAGLSTGGVPQIVFYLCGNALWKFFSTSLSETSRTFLTNSAIMGKVYFPRLVMPISSVITGLLDFAIQIFMLVIIMVGYSLGGYSFNVGPLLLLAPVLVLQVGLLGLGVGIIISACTTKYRDLSVLAAFGIQLWMYASPVVYSADLIGPRYFRLYMIINPMAPIMECWRSIVIGAGSFYLNYLIISAITTLLVLGAGVLLFSRVEKTFMDTV